jgi:hypothetical protein
LIFSFLGKIVKTGRNSQAPSAGLPSEAESDAPRYNRLPFEGIISGLDLAVLVFDDEERIVYCNNACCRLCFGNGDCDVMNLDQIFDQEDLTFIRVFLLSSGTAESRQFETSVMTESDGELQHIPVVVNVFRCQSDNIVTMQNISERRNTELSLQKQNVRVQNIIDIYSEITGRFLNCISRYEVLQNLDDALARLSITQRLMFTHVMIRENSALSIQPIRFRERDLFPIRTE